MSLLTTAGFGEVTLRHIAFTHRLADADEIWNGLVDGTVRMAALVTGQREAIRTQIRARFDRLVAEYAVPDGLEIPVSIKIVSGRKIAQPSSQPGQRGAN
ncbi:MAG: hypothetical protein M3451_01430 [Chloroflexota bacterium]|jgi:hypothetical protein|nr:hypothetical protein [Chloroflexota bacterium]